MSGFLYYVEAVGWGLLAILVLAIGAALLVLASDHLFPGAGEGWDADDNYPTRPFPVYPASAHVVIGEQAAQDNQP